MLRRLVPVLLAAACSKQAGSPPPPEVRLATDLPAPIIDTALRLIALSGGPRAERVAGFSAGAEALARGATPGEPGDLRWDS